LKAAEVPVTAENDRVAASAHNSTQQENTDIGVKHLYVRINIFKANYKNNITL